MDRRILKQLSDIRKEVQELDRAAGYVRKRMDLITGVMRNRGHPESDKRLQELQKKKSLMEKKKTELLQLELQAEIYIQSVEEDSGLRRILRLRYMEELSWQQVAARMGSRYSAESCRKKVERFMSEKETGR